MKVKVTCDSTADLSNELLCKYTIETIPLYITLDGKSYRDSIDIQPEDIYEYSDRTGILPKTAASSVQNYLDVFSKAHETYDAIIHISLGQSFSSSYQNAYIASQEFDNVYVVNSNNLSTGTGHVVLEAASLANQGLAANEIVSRLESLIPRLETSFVVDTLEYLKRGGRCSAVTAFSANLLNIKPCIEVTHGKMDVGKKYRGKIEKSIQKYVIDRLKDREDIINDRIFITHSGSSEQLINQVKELIELYHPFKEIIVTKASCTISCHCGPNTLGILFKRK